MDLRLRVVHAVTRRSHRGWTSRRAHVRPVAGQGHGRHDDRRVAAAAAQRRVQAHPLRRRVQKVVGFGKGRPRLGLER